MRLINILKSNKILVNIFSYGFATVSSSILSFITGVITRNLLGPEKYGYWLTISIIFTFIPLFQLGILNAMNREIPYYLARKDYRNVRNIKDLALSFLLTFPLIIVIIFFLVSGTILLFDFGNEYKVGFFLASLISFFIYLSIFVEVNYRAEQNFKMASKLVSIKSITQSILTIVFVMLYGYLGMFLGMFCANIIELIVAKKAFLNFNYRFEFREYRRLIKIGFPILMIGFLWSVLIASDRLIIAIFLSPKELGDYGVGMMLFSSMMIFPNVIGQVLYPKIVELVSKEMYKDIYSYYWRVNKLLTLITFLIVIAAYLLFPVFVKYVMPSYLSGIAAGQILIIGIFPLTLVGLAANYLNASNHQNKYLKILTIVILTNILLSLLLVYLKPNILSVAIGTSLSYFLYFFLINASFLKLIKNELK